MVSKRSREQATQLIFPLFHPTILFDKATCPPSEEIQTSAEDRWLSGWNCGVGGASLQSVRTSFPFWKPPLPATLENCHTVKIWENKKILNHVWFDFRCIYSCSNSTEDAKQVASSRKDYRTHQLVERWLQTDVLLVYLWFCRHTFCSHSLYILLFCLCVCL